MEARIIVKNVTTESKKTFKAYKLVDEKNNGKLVDCVMCKSVKAEMREKLDSLPKAKVVGDISINYNYEFPKAFIRSLESVEKV